MMDLTVSRGADWECTVTVRSKSSGQLSATGFYRIKNQNESISNAFSGVTQIFLRIFSKTSLMY